MVNDYLFINYRNFYCCRIIITNIHFWQITCRTYITHCEQTMNTQYNYVAITRYLKLNYLFL